MKKITRFFKCTGFLLWMGCLIACSSEGGLESALLPTKQPTQDETQAAADIFTGNGRYQEAPMLAERVAAGDLPPVDERLPLNPRVLPVYDEIGSYGGTWRRAYSGLGDRWGPTKLIEERMVEFYMPDPDTLDLELTWVDQFEPNEDNTAFTVHIREGLKWSDGEPVTTEDVRFWYEDIFLNPEFYPTLPSSLMVGGEPLAIKIVDKYTFVIQFVESYALFPLILAKESPGAIGLQGTTFLLPAHYLKNFHPTYTDIAELDRIAAEYDVASWHDLWDEGPIQAWWLNPDLPVLAAWKIVVPPPENTIIMERNPYYYAVDEMGNQLPYIDRITHELFTDNETLSLWVVQGLIDLQSRHIDPIDYTVYKNNEAQGNYHVVNWRGGETQALFPNLNTPDPVLAQLFDDVRFRQALSLAIDQEEINQLVSGGLGEARQASPASGSPQYDAEFEHKWIAYEPDTANALLDDIGLVWSEDGRYRLRPDGRPLQLTITLPLNPDRELILDWLQRYWTDVGIQMQVERLDRLDYEAKTGAGEVEIGLWVADRNMIIASDPSRYLGTMADGPWAPLYGLWYDSGGQKGVEPLPDHAIRDVWAMWERAKSAATTDEAYEYLQQMIDIHKENVWMIGLVGEEPRIYIVNNRIRNFPDDLVNDEALRDIGLAQPAQIFLAGANADNE